MFISDAWILRIQRQHLFSAHICMTWTHGMNPSPSVDVLCTCRQRLTTSLCMFFLISKYTTGLCWKFVCKKLLPLIDFLLAAASTYSNKMAEDIDNHTVVGLGQHQLVEPGELAGAHFCIQDDNRSLGIGRGEFVISFEEIWLWPNE